MSTYRVPSNNYGLTVIILVMILAVIAVVGWIGFWFFADCKTVGYVYKVTDMPGRCIPAI